MICVAEQLPTGEGLSNGFEAFGFGLALAPAEAVREIDEIFVVLALADYFANGVEFVLWAR